MSGKDPKVRSQLLGDFHVLLAEVVGNGVLTEILQELVARSSLITMLYQSVRDAACSSDEHVEFLKAAKAGDSEGGGALMLAHLDHVEAALRFDRPPRRGTWRRGCWRRRGDGRSGRGCPRIRDRAAWADEVS